jgi:hypothetical protein
MKPHQERVVIEKKELDEKLIKLYDFLTGELIQSLPDEDQLLLKQQYKVMKEYSTILSDRIERFN